MRNCGFFWPSESTLDQRNARLSLQGIALLGRGWWSPNSLGKVCSHLDCHAEIYCHLQPFLDPSVFNLMLIYDLLEAPVGGLHLHSISLVGLARFFFCIDILSTCG